MVVLLNSLESIFRSFRAMALLVTPLKYYRNDPPGYTPAVFSTILRNVKTKRIRKTPLHWELACTYTNETRETHIYLRHPFDPTKPSVVFHHPSGETNHAFAFNVILGDRIASRCNVFLIKAQKHNSTNEFLHECVDTFLHHQLTFAGSTLAAQEIVNYHRAHSKTKIVISGASMGGIVTTMHAYFFGSADYYVPLAAYPNVGKIFLGNSYKYGVNNWRTLRTRASYLRSFDLPGALKPSLAKRITPVLGIYDNIVPYSDASKFWNQKGVSFKAFPYGHFTPAIKRQKVQQIILTAIT